MRSILCNRVSAPTSLLSKAFSSPSPSLCPRFSQAPRKPNLVCARSLIIEAVEGETAEETPAKSTSRRLILLRHAESSWEDRSLRDHDRPLSEAGRTDALNVSRKLQQMGWIPELILSRVPNRRPEELAVFDNRDLIDATRTRETLQIMQEHVQGFLKAKVHFISSFYSIAAMDGQTAEHLQQAICEYATNEILTVMCMGHNKGWEEAASMFSGTAVELKTCNAALLEAAGKSWDEAFAAAGFGGWKLHGIVKPIP